MPKNPIRPSSPGPRLTELPALGMDSVSLVADLRRYYNHTLGRDKTGQSHVYHALALVLRDRLVERWKATREAYRQRDCRRVHYLSMEFLVGRVLNTVVLNLGLKDAVEQAVGYLGLTVEEILAGEQDTGLGAGSLGELAVGLLDSCASAQLPVVGYGLRYEYGPFRQQIVNGRQVEQPSHWLRGGNPWELERPEYVRRVHFGGHSEFYNNPRGELQVRWMDTYDVLAVPYDILVPGYQNGTVNTLRLWKAVATEVFDPLDQSAGGYSEAVASKHAAELITLVRYTDEVVEASRAWRLRQQYFLVSATLQDVVAQWVETHGENFTQFVDRNCFQLNDSHPALAVVELMRLLMDEHGIGWDDAWGVTTRVMAYTHHAPMPETLEQWPVRLFRELLPRLLDIIYEINTRFLAAVAHRWPGDNERLRRMSIIDEGEDSQIRMASLAVVASFSVNGVAATHSRQLQRSLFKDFAKLWPHKFTNQTNGVTQRRWLAGCNPGLTRLIHDAIGERWLIDPEELQRLAPLAEDGDFRARWQAVRQANKARLASWVQACYGIRLDTEALFDAQIRGIHGARRQLLNMLHAVHLYDRLLRGETEEWTPRCLLLGGKAAPGDALAKNVIELITNVAETINHDPKAGDRLKVVFLPDHSMSLMEKVCPAADLSEQIATAGREAAGTGTIKFMMNGAVTIGTADGVSGEIREAVGDENFFAFGRGSKEMEALRKDYDPLAWIEADEEIRRVFERLQSGHCNRFGSGVFEILAKAVLSPNDPWLVVADLRGLIDAQRRVAAAYRDPERWTRMSIIQTAASGRFAADRTVAQYNDGIWRLEPVAAWPVG